MKYARWLWLFFLIGVPAMVFAGDIQVFCAPGLRVSLDGEYMGTSSPKADGLFLIDVPKGAHTLRVEKAGFVPQTIEIEVSNLSVEITVGDLSPIPLIRYKPETEEKTVEHLVGNLVITSAPQNCVVEIDGTSKEKNTPQLSIGGLSAGEHTVAFSKDGYDRITGVVSIEPGAEVSIRGNLMAGKVEIIQEGKGSLRVISKPERCTVRFQGQIKEKTSSRLNLTHIPAGTYPIGVSIKGRELYTNVLIKDGARTILEVSFFKGEEPFVVSYVSK